MEADDLLEAPPRAGKRASTKKIAAANASNAAPARKTAPAKATKGSPARTAARKADARWSKRALALQGARTTPYPHDFKPQLTDHRATAPDGEQWLHEIKWDGYRLLADVRDGVVALRSRGGLNWTDDFPEVVQAIERLPVRDLRLDGELVVLDAQGRSDFTALQKVIDGAALCGVRYAGHRRGGCQPGATAGAQGPAQGAAGQQAGHPGLQRPRARPWPGGVRRQWRGRLRRHHQQADRRALRQRAFARLDQDQA